VIVLPLAHEDVHRTHRDRPEVKLFPLNRNLGRRRTDVLDALRDQHNLPRLPISPKAGGEHRSVAVHSAAEAPDAISLAQHSTNQRVRVPPSPSPPGGGTDPEVNRG
jgi:hypothetical protein